MSRHPQKPRLVLASSSPRRRELLAGAGVSFEVRVPRVDEIPGPGEAPEAFAARAAAEKAASVAAALAGSSGAGDRVIGCDTVVARGRRILGKPATAAEARRMLRALSGRRHEVLTAVCLLARSAGGGWRERALVSRTTVRFRKLASAEIDRYVRSGEPMDKAGAYGIQGGAAGMVREINGSYTNVVGLPLAELLELLAPRPSRRRARAHGEGNKTC